MGAQASGGVVGARLVRELQGHCCHELAPSEDGQLARKSVACTRSFGQHLSSYQDVLSAVGTFASRAAEKLRRQDSAVNVLTVFISKNRFGSEPPPHTFSATITLPTATSDTGELLRYARALLKRLWQPNTIYKKAGVVFDGLEQDGCQQLTLFDPKPNCEQRTRLMAELDQLNQRYGTGTVSFGTAYRGKGQKVTPWVGKAEWQTPAYTTCFEGLLRIDMDALRMVRKETLNQAGR
ncbi:DUF4113 domain-containing protein [Hymenobacter sp. GOD-10R]|uniref:DinB/UmuC family translesion DNA polymerase n=1 Tax=Hymenobacter sp. GOD-10R TaxID=3093922 RepID=UPI002D776CC5|nr:DUF4113 domain-containing protein [Hymenobacter sp. GOD-10R]WRQ28131.1 DUF4113 domain-containing protein [Hymenobacter sp. GOD-10R]